MRRLVWPAVILLAGLPAAAGQDRAGEALERARRVSAIIELVRERYQGAEAFTQDFVQETSSRVFGPDQEARGTIFARKPDRLRFAYSDPEGQVGVFDGTTWWLLDPEEQHVTIHETGEDDLVVSLLTGSLELVEAFSVTVRETQRRLVTLELLPRQTRDDVERVFIDVDEKNGDLRRVEIEDPLQNRTRYRFGPMEEVVPPPMSSFTLSIPEGYTVDRN